MDGVFKLYFGESNVLPTPDFIKRAAQKPWPTIHFLHRERRPPPSQAHSARYYSICMRELDPTCEITVTASGVQLNIGIALHARSGRRSAGAVARLAMGPSIIQIRTRPARGGPTYFQARRYSIDFDALDRRDAAHAAAALHPPRIPGLGATDRIRIAARFHAPARSWLMADEVDERLLLTPR